MDAEKHDMISNCKERRAEELLSRKGSRAESRGSGCREILLHVLSKAVLQHEKAAESPFLPQKIAVHWQNCPIARPRPWWGGKIDLLSLYSG